MKEKSIPCFKLLDPFDILVRISKNVLGNKARYFYKVFTFECVLYWLRISRDLPNDCNVYENTIGLCWAIK